MAQSDDMTPGGQVGAQGEQGEQGVQSTQSGQDDPYEGIVGEILSSTKPKELLEKDTDAICARLVEELKKKNPIPEGASEEGLFSQARQMYWDWIDAKRAKERSGKEEFQNTAVEI